LRLHNIDYLEAEAGPFMLLDLQPYMKEPKDEYEKVLVHRMVDHGVYVAPGFAFHTHRPGFFRLTFALPWDELQDGLIKLVKALK
jgi:DNA-binding transcriptional MocR family regulator